MKENSIKNERSSIEEDMKILENLKTAIETGLVNFGGKSMYDCGYQEAIENILSDYKRVLKINEILLKENKELRVSNKKLYEIGQEMCKQDKYTSENYIPIQKVKNKMEELSKMKGDLATYIATSERIKVLQELLGKE